MGCSYIDAIFNSVVLPDPLAPSTTQRWFASTVHVSGDKNRSPVTHETDLDQA